MTAPNVTTRELRDCWGVDLSAKLVDYRRLAAATIPGGGPIAFVARYVSLGPQGAGDLSQSETDAILAAGLALIGVQHCRASQGQGWDAGGARGRADGHWAAVNAAGAGLVAGIGIALALDLEDVSQSTWGQPTIDHATEWCREVAAGGFEPVCYVGFNCGLTPQQLYDLPTVRRYWSDYGPRVVTTRGFCLKQHAQTTVAGVAVDPDYASADQLGDCLLGMAQGAPPPAVA
jgi:hypothetical protein